MRHCVELLSDRIVVLVDDVEGCLHVGDEDLAILDFDPEFPFECVMDVNAGFDIGAPALVAPVRLEADGHSLAISKWVRSSGRGRSSSVDH